MRQTELVVNTSIDFLVENRREMMFDQYEIYRRGKEDAARPTLTGPLPFPGTPEDHDYMTPYPRAHVIPVGNGQRSDVEAKRLVDFLLDNDIEVRQLRRDYRFGNRTFQAGSYVVWLNQSLRALANTMLDVGDSQLDCGQYQAATTRVVGWLRWEMDAWAGMRPARFYAGMRSPLADPEGIDFVVIIMAARKPELFWLYALLATAGSLLGAMVTDVDERGTLVRDASLALLHGDGGVWKDASGASV